jgi:hypothetical protein
MTTLFQKLVDQVLAANQADEKELERYLLSLRDEGKLQLSGLEGREIHSINSWDAFVKGSDKSWHIRDAANLIGKWCTYLSFSHRREDEEKKQAIATLLLTGTVSQDDYYLTSSDVTDQVTGDRGRITLINWKPEFWILDRKDGRYQHTLATSIEKIRPVTVEFTAPSGELLFTDIFRHDNFPDLTEPSSEEKYDSLSLSSVVGRQALSEFYAKTHNFGYCQTTNTYVAVFQKDNDIIVTEKWHDGDDVQIEGWDLAGEFSCDIWRITTIDKAEFIRITGKKDASSLEAYLSSRNAYSDNYARVKIPACSRIHMTSGENFNEMLDKKSLSIPDHVFVWAHYHVET